MVRFKQDVCNYLRLPDIPKKKWDGKTSFEYGVGVAITKNEEQCYVVVSFDADEDKEPRIKKVFGYDIIKSINEVFVVPAYMNDENVEQMDLDEESKKRALEVAKEAREIENEGVAEIVETPQSEWFFDEIHDRQEAEAWLKEYNRVNRIKGGIPKKEETLKMRLGVIWTERNNKQ